MITIQNLLGKPTKDKLNQFLLLGVSFIILSFLDLLLNSFLDKNITFFLPGWLSYFTPLLFGFLGLYYIRIEFSGNKNLDSLVTGELSIEALNFSTIILKKQGIFVSKIFMGSSFNEIVKIAKKKFKKIYIFKPPSSRKDSKESFIICKDLR